MPVVINEFEVLGEAPAVPRNDSSLPAQAAAGKDKPDPLAIQLALLVLQQRASRLRAH